MTRRLSRARARGGVKIRVKRRRRKGSWGREKRRVDCGERETKGGRKKG